MHDLLTELSSVNDSFVSMRYRMWFIGCMLLAAFSACRKDDRQRPVVTILSPMFPISYTFGDLIEVEVDVQDNERIEFISILVTDAAGRVAAGPRTIRTSGIRSYRGTFVLPFDDIHVESGPCVLRAVASDGHNEGQDFKAVTMFGAPRVLKRLLVIRQPDSFTTVVDSLAAGSTLTPGLELSGQFSRLTAHSRDQSIHLFGRTTDGVHTLSGTGLFHQQTTSIPFGLGSDLFADVWYDQGSKETWVACRDGIIRQIGAAGHIAASFQAFQPRQLVASGRFVYVYGSNGINTRKIEVYIKSTGALIQTFNLNEELIDLLALDTEDRILLVRNATGQNPLIPYSRIGNFTDAWTSFNGAPSGTVSAACSFSQGVLIAQNGMLRRYSHAGNLIAETALSSNPSALAYQEDSGVCWVLESGSLNAFGGTGLQLIASIPVQPGAKDIALLYNK